MNPHTPILSVENLSKRFDISGGLLDQLKFREGRLKRVRTLVRAVNGVSFTIFEGETFSVVGESGCGKSTLARTVMGLYPPNAGAVRYREKRIDTFTHQQMLPYRRRMQMIFQDPYASLNPRKTVAQTLLEPVTFHNPGMSRSEAEDRVAAVMRQVGVDPEWSVRFPHEFSGGQRQRISIARALMVDPEFIVADEPVSALDVSIQAQILNLLMDAQKERNLTYLFITHDLSVVEHISSRVAVMYLGCLCETSPAAAMFEHPRHPYTVALLSAIPRITREKKPHLKLKGEVPTPINLPTGCVFHGRCPHSDGKRCVTEIPNLLEYGGAVFVACHGVEEGRV